MSVDQLKNYLLIKLIINKPKGSHKEKIIKPMVFLRKKCKA